MWLACYIVLTVIVSICAGFWGYRIGVNRRDRQRRNSIQWVRFDKNEILDIGYYAIRYKRTNKDIPEVWLISGGYWNGLAFSHLARCQKDIIARSSSMFRYSMEAQNWGVEHKDENVQDRH